MLEASQSIVHWPELCRVDKPRQTTSAKNGDT